MKKLRHAFEYVLMKIILFPLNILPKNFAVALGGFFGGILWSLGVRRKVSRFNLKLCMPELDCFKADKILRESYKNFCRSMVEFAILPRYKGNTAKFVKLEEAGEVLNLAKSGEGALLVTGHFGSWELLGAALCEAGVPLDFLVGEQTNPSVDGFINGVRAKMGIGIIHMGVAARGIIQSVKGGRMVAMLSDQDAGKSSVIVNFFGNPASTPQGIAAFALKLKCPIVFGGIFRKDSSISHTVFAQVLRPDYSNLPNDKDEAIREITQVYTSKLEEVIRQAPHLYFWPHRRFKRTLEYPK